MFTRYGLSVMIPLVLALGALSAVSACWVSDWVGSWLGLTLAAIFALLVCLTLWFFRDPPRAVSENELDIVSPADGTVTDVITADADSTEFIEGKAHMVGIFLSVFDVHVNRSPLPGTVAYLRYKPGKFLDARHPECARLNEQQAVGLRCDDDTRFIVRQIAGLVARRIVCPLREGDRLGRGERFGMIRFGSRTELWIEAGADVEWLIRPGEQVKGGSSVIGRLLPRRSS